MKNTSEVLTTAIPVDGSPGGRQDATTWEPPTGVNILLVIIYGAMVGIMCVLFVQRLLLRIAPKYAKGYTDITKHAPKSLKEDIQKRLMQTMNIHSDPVLLPNDDHRYQCLPASGIEHAQAPYNYLYRMKVLDHLKKLENSLYKQDEALKRPCRKDLAQHLRDIKSHSAGILKNVRGTQMKLLAESYTHARYKPENFGVEEYERFSEVYAEVMTAIDQKSKKKRSGKKLTSRKNTNSSSSASATSKPGIAGKYLDTEPLIQEQSTTP